MTIVHKAVTYLADQQNHDGGFAAWSSASNKPFIMTRCQPTAFHTSLILDCLQVVAGTDDIRSKAAAYVRGQANANGTWNYWLADSQATKTEPYPDDLDDTAVALAALSRQDPAAVGAKELGALARCLVDVEQAKGGPYNTWLVDTQKMPEWQQVDPAVNANIGYVLSLQQVTPSGLRTYLADVIKNDTYQSAFYIGDIPTIYFLSRWYQGSEQPALKRKISILLSDALSYNCLQLAMLLSAAHYQGVTLPTITRNRQRLTAMAKDGYWPAEALYIDPAYNGEQYYGGSSLLSTAFALEALSLAAIKSLGLTDRLSTVRQQPAYPRLQYNAVGIPSAALRRDYMRAISRVLQGVNGNQISNAASIAVQTGGWQIDAASIQSLNSASLHGWLAYTLYDDALDGNGATNSICLANIAHRRSFEGFLKASKELNFKRLVRKTFDMMDAANDWEYRQARGRVIGDTLMIMKLPRYGDFARLAERSLGHSLAAVGVAATYYGSVDHPQVAELQRFFYHFLIARQLNDDAHDWEDDVRAGRLSAVVTRLLTDCDYTKGSISLTQTMPKFKKMLWEKTIDTVIADIEHHTIEARHALHELDLKQPAELEGWLTVLEASAHKARLGRDEALQFMAAYGAHNE